MNTGTLVLLQGFRYVRENFGIFSRSFNCLIPLLSNNTGLQKKIVTSTKVGEVNSIFYAEFKYVLGFSLSRRVFKWNTFIIWRKRIFTYYINVFLHYLKSSCGWFSVVCRLWNISLERPAVVSQHTEAPLALVPLFRVGNVLMKSLSVLVTDGAKILREEVLSESLRTSFINSLIRGPTYIPS
jgi:hypothetical protein